jgi:hypothetical protein
VGSGEMGRWLENLFLLFALVLMISKGRARVISQREDSFAVNLEGI